MMAGVTAAFALWRCPSSPGTRDSGLGIRIYYGHPPPPSKAIAVVSVERPSCIKNTLIFVLYKPIKQREGEASALRQCALKVKRPEFTPCCNARPMRDRVAFNLSYWNALLKSQGLSHDSSTSRCRQDRWTSGVLSIGGGQQSHPPHTPSELRINRIHTAKSTTERVLGS